MAKYYYYNEKGEKKGAFSGKEIKAMAKGGLINPETVIETEEGKAYLARGIGGVEFGNKNMGTGSFPEFSMPLPHEETNSDLHQRIFDLEKKLAGMATSSLSGGDSNDLQQSLHKQKIAEAQYNAALIENATNDALANHRYREAQAHLWGCAITIFLFIAAPFIFLAMIANDINKGCAPMVIVFIIVLACASAVVFL